MQTTVGHAGNLSGEVVGVTDGDTVTVLDHEKRQIKVRLAGIDAPEKRQPFGQKSKASLSELTYRKDGDRDHGQDRSLRAHRGQVAGERPGRELGASAQGNGVALQGLLARAVGH